VLCLLELGDMLATDTEIDAYDSIAEERQLLFELFVAKGFRAMRALMQGRFADSECLAQEALAIGQRLQTDNSAGIFGIQIFTLRREQGRLKELESVVRYFVQQHTVAGSWRPALVHRIYHYRRRVVFDVAVKNLECSKHCIFSNLLFPAFFNSP